MPPETLGHREAACNAHRSDVLREVDHGQPSESVGTQVGDAWELPEQRRALILEALAHGVDAAEALARGAASPDDTGRTWRRTPQVLQQPA
eukprot:16451996-Heterocapsa_arctica.AAC.1